MSLNKYLDQLLEKLEKSKDLEEISATGAGEAYDTPKAFKSKGGSFSASGEEDENDNAENSGYKKVKESIFKRWLNLHS